MQTRLLSALDTLDVMQSKHSQEFSAWKQHRDRLQAQLNHYINVVKTVELEREDMRDAVLRLVEKSESMFRVGGGLLLYCRLITHPRCFYALFCS